MVGRKDWFTCEAVIEGEGVDPRRHGAVQVEPDLASPGVPKLPQSRHGVPVLLLAVGGFLSGAGQQVSLVLQLGDQVLLPPDPLLQHVGEGSLLLLLGRQLRAKPGQGGVRVI